MGNQNLENFRAGSGARSQDEYTREQQTQQQSDVQGKAAQDIAAQEQARYAAFDPEAFARAQTDAAGALQAYQARRMGANAGKAARLGNFGLQQAQANAMGQGLGIKQGMGQGAYGMRAGQQGMLGQESLARGGLAQGYGSQQLQAMGMQQQERRDLAQAGGNVLTTAGKMAGMPMAKGGEVKEGENYTVNEVGVEAFVPKQDGTIIPNKIIKELSPKGKKLMERFLLDVYPHMKDKKNGR